MATYKASWTREYTIEFRDLTWKEYDTICRGVDPKNIDPQTAIDVYKTCVLDGPDLRLVTAGIVMFVAKHQIQGNPFAGDFNSINDTLEIARDYVGSNYLVAAQAIISSVFKYPIEDIKDFTAEKFFLRLAQAEVLFGKVSPSQPNKEVPTQPRIPLSPQDKIAKKVKERDNKALRNQ